MTTYYAEQSKSYWPVVDAKAAGSVKAVRGVFALTAALALNDVINMLSMPAQHVPVDCILDCDDLDSGGSPSITRIVDFRIRCWASRRYRSHGSGDRSATCCIE